MSTPSPTTAPLQDVRPAVTHISGLSGCAKGWKIAELSKVHKKLVVICSNSSYAEQLSEDISFFASKSAQSEIGDGAVRTAPLILPAWDCLPLEAVSPQLHITAQRIAVIEALTDPTLRVTVIIPLQALFQKVLSREQRDVTERRVLRVGDACTLDDLSALLHAQWYQKASLVEDVGEYCVRGGVIDVFPALYEAPVRIEFGSGVITRLVSFDSQSQRSTTPVAQLQLYPVRELPARNLAERLNLRAAIEQIKLRGKELETPPREIARAMSALRNSEEIPGIELLTTIGYNALCPLFDYFPTTTQLVLCDSGAINAEAEHTSSFISERATRLESEHFLHPKREQLYLSSEEVFAHLQRYSCTELDSLVLDNTKQHERSHQIIRSEPLTALRTQLKTKIGSGDAFSPLSAAIHRFRSQHYLVAIAVGSAHRAERLQRILLDLNIDAVLWEEGAWSWLHRGTKPPVVIIQGHLSEGVELADEKLIFIAEQEIFSERSYRKGRGAKTNLKRLLASLAQLSEDDYLVHADYGIGIYRGLAHLDISGVEADFLHIQYADSVLYLPVHNIGKVQKFVAAEGQAPHLDKLGSNQWVKTKERIKQAVLPLAGDLIKLYASRSIATGWRFEPMGAEDERFADEFSYNETADQLKAIEETIKDMATDKPMDRLVCGDVGFGKTEVAIRAAFKCVQHRRQVAVLVPTTLLVEQHVRTFQGRFQGYDVAIAGMSRFNSKQKNKEILTKLASGEIDIVVGTHRLFSRDVVFNDLGLLIIDEEHRFGVKHKEKLKSIRKNVDVLTLTATPIPRTLHMSLLGIRDISVISTPPTNRRLISTYVAGYDDGLVRDAILREIARSGQVFYLHNRVESIDLVCSKLQQLVPEARFCFAHGQMSESQLEEIMTQFVNKHIDVLVTTTIIESGLDIPSANTILIERADAYGLSQLYQLRGRVGRSDIQAYCYFLIPKSLKVSGDAHRRLKALQSLDDLGLGFNLAVRDLEIRGAGNLLGKEQSGNVLAVGFDLYSKILKEAVLHLKGEELALDEVVDPEIKLGVTAFIPDFYIPDVSERLIMYQRLSGAKDNKEIDDLWSEMEDRFGPPPREVSELAELMRFRTVLRQYGVVKIEQRASAIILSFNQRAPIDPEKLLSLVRKRPERYKFSRAYALTLSYEKLPPPYQVYAEVQQVLKEVGI